MIEILDSIDEFLLNAQQHEFLLVLYGVILYHSVWYSISKDKFNAKDKSFRFLHWLKLHSDNIWVTFLVGMLVIIFDDELIELIDIDETSRFHSLIYLGAGPISDILRELVRKLTKI